MNNTFNSNDLNQKITNCLIDFINKAGGSAQYPELIDSVKNAIPEAFYLEGNIIFVIDYLIKSNKLKIDNHGVAVIINPEENINTGSNLNEPMQNNEANKNTAFELTHQDMQIINLLKNRFKLQFGFEPTTEQLIQHALRRMLNDEPTTCYNLEENRSSFVPPQKFSPMPENYPEFPPPFVGGMNPPGYPAFPQPYMDTYRSFNPGFEQDPANSHRQQSSPFNTQHSRTWTDFNNFVEPPPPLKKTKKDSLNLGVSFKAYNFCNRILTQTEDAFPKLAKEVMALGITEAQILNAIDLLKINSKQQTDTSQINSFLSYFKNKLG